MTESPAGLVEIIRDYLSAHRLMRVLFERHRRGELRFADLEELVGDDERSILFRLKERCHALFRPGMLRGSEVAMRREVLFDLAVGSLFHEAMKLRENLYQHEVYSPRLRELRELTGDDPDAEAIFAEFERLLTIVARRLEEDIREVEALFVRTRDQLRLLLAEHRGEGHVARCLLENRRLAEEVFAESLDDLLESIYGDSAEGYALAGRSYLSSGYFAEADRPLAEALARGGDREALRRLSTYARGMAAYVAGEYEESVKRLGQWLESGGRDDEGLAEFAQAAISRIGQLVQGDRSEAVVRAAGRLLERFSAAGPHAAPSDPA